MLADSDGALSRLFVALSAQLERNHLLLCLHVVLLGNVIVLHHAQAHELLLVHDFLGQVSCTLALEDEAESLLLPLFKAESFARYLVKADLPLSYAFALAFFLLVSDSIGHYIIYLFGLGSSAEFAEDVSPGLAVALLVRLAHFGLLSVRG